MVATKKSEARTIEQQDLSAIEPVRDRERQSLGFPPAERAPWPVPELRLDFPFFGQVHGGFDLVVVSGWAVWSVS